MLLHFGRLTRLFKPLPPVAKNYYESGCFSALRYQPVTYLRLQFLCNVSCKRDRPDMHLLHKEKLTLEKLNPDLVPYNITEEQKKMVSYGEAYLAQELEKLLMVLFVAKQRGDYLPSQLSLRDMRVMLEMRYSKRMEYLKTCIYKELQDKIRKLRKLLLKDKLVEFRKERKESRSEDAEWLDYHLFGNAMFERILKRNVNGSNRLRETVAMQFEQHIVFDFSFDHLMRHRDAKDCAKQLSMAIAINKKLRRPFNITFCCFNEKENVAENLLFIAKGIKDTAMRFTEKSFEHLYPREKLVYLTPDCQDDLVYNPEDVYIIGALVDKIDREPYTAGKARRLGIRVARLPIDKYVNWQIGCKSLCINQVFSILACVKEDGDWIKACALHIPARKMAGVTQRSHPSWHQNYMKFN